VTVPAAANGEEAKITNVSEIAGLSPIEPEAWCRVGRSTVSDRDGLAAMAAPAAGPGRASGHAGRFRSRDDRPSERIIEQRVRNRVIEALEVLAEGDDGVRRTGNADYVNQFFDLIDDDVSSEWRALSTFSSGEVNELDKVRRLLLDACAGTHLRSAPITSSSLLDGPSEFSLSQPRRWGVCEIRGRFSEDRVRERSAFERTLIGESTVARPRQSRIPVYVERGSGQPASLPMLDQNGVRRVDRFFSGWVHYSWKASPAVVSGLGDPTQRTARRQPGALTPSPQLAGSRQAHPASSRARGGPQWRHVCGVLPACVLRRIGFSRFRLGPGRPSPALAGCSSRCQARTTRLRSDSSSEVVSPASSLFA
jgi:hypothetical protein